MANVFFVPKFIVSGEGALHMSMDNMKEFGKKALIVTDDMMIKLGNVGKLTDELDGAGIEYAIYSGVNSEPTHTMVNEGIEIYNEGGCDFLIAIGGGSPMDTAKAIGAVITNGGNICDYQGKKLDNELPPIVAIPTTAGTGSEATRVSIIADTDRGIKLLISDIKLLASLAVVDPVFTMTAPPAVTANTGVDALCHAIESYTSNKAFPMSKLFSKAAVKKIFDHLPTAYADGSNVEARREMAEAATQAGIAFSNASVTVIHGMSRPIGALFHVPHGLSNAMLLKVCLPYIREGAEVELYELAKEIGAYNGENTAEGADAFVAATNELLAKLNIQSPADFGIDKDEFFAQIDKMAHDGLGSGSPANCKNIPTEDQLKEMYKALWD